MLPITVEISVSFFSKQIKNTNSKNENASIDAFFYGPTQHLLSIHRFQKHSVKRY